MIDAAVLAAVHHGALRCSAALCCNAGCWAALSDGWQLTLWGPVGEINDYASKLWSGLVGDYYATRWKVSLSLLSFSFFLSPLDFSHHSRVLLVGSYQRKLALSDLPLC